MEIDQLAEYDPHGRVTLLDHDETIACAESGNPGQVCPNPSNIPFGFVGALRSELSGMVYMRNRWYSPRLAQFLSHDPLGYVDSYNPYAYVAFDPVNGWDPWGLETGSFAEDLRYDIDEILPRPLECALRDCSSMPDVDDELQKEAAKKKVKQAKGVAAAAATAPVELLRKPSGDEPPAPIFNEDQVEERQGEFWGGILTIPFSLGVNAAAGAGIGRGLAKGADEVGEEVDGLLAPGKASSANSAVRLKNQLAAEEIAGGHAFKKHVVDGQEFAEFGIKTRQEFSQHIEGILGQPSAQKELARGRHAYWDDASGTVVIRSGDHPDGGTAFRPKTGRAYYENLE